MAIKSPLNPGVIARERRVTPESVQNFISGGTPLGSSVVASAANKIVGFQRGAAGVAPQVPDLGSIINTLSSNILNNVENRVQSITQNVNQIVQKTVGDLQNKFASKTDAIDANAPNKILQNFLSLYDKAIGYIRFFANPNNVKSLGESLVELKKVFEETFNVAKGIRQTIIRIVNQLSSLPTATAAGGGGINLDVDIPGPGLKKGSNTGLLRSMKRRPGLMLGGAALAGAGAGAVVTNALQDAGGGVQPQMMGETGEGLSGPLLDKFNGILDRFSKAINSLGKQQRQPSGGKTTSTTKDKSPVKPSGPSGPSGPAVMPESDQELYTLATIAGLESGTAQGQADVAQAVYNRMAKGNTSATDILTRPGQFEPAFTAPYKISGGTIDPAAKNIKTFDDAVRFRMKKTGEKREVAETAIKSTIANLQNVSLQQNAASFVGARTSFRGSPQNTGNKLINSVWRGSRSDNQYLNEEVYSKGTASVPLFVAGSVRKPVTVEKLISQQSKVSPSTTQATTKQQIAQTVSQPPITQSQPQVNIIPMQSGSENKQGTARPPQPSISGIRGETVPMLPTTNPDNFLTLYSKMVYNIVDG